MMWTSHNYPRRFHYLSSRVREKAITIGNALLQQNIPPRHAEQIAYDRAVDWARRDRPGDNGPCEHHVLPYRDGWALQYGKKPTAIFPCRESALEMAYELAKGKASDVILHGLDGKIIERSSFA